MAQEQLDEQATHTVRRLLHENWDPGTTAGYDPTLNPETEGDALPLHFGNYNGDLPDPQVSIAQPQGEFTIGGRWSGKNMQADKMVQFRRGLVLVQCWATSGTTYNNGQTAKDIVATLREEVERVLGQFDQGPTSGANANVIVSFSTQWDGRFPDPETDTTQPTWQSQVRVTYDWDREA